MPPSTVRDTISVSPWFRAACVSRDEISSGWSIIKPSIWGFLRIGLVWGDALPRVLRILQPYARGGNGEEQERGGRPPKPECGPLRKMKKGSGSNIFVDSNSPPGAEQYSSLTPFSRCK
jgi:hypothetical protein